ncbi:helix-turn-helix domain-containing protein [Paenibacillus sp. MMS20-IR301]|uniref:helix-turn-helix domain-containing protein n=1 Tax=Paenibacillus sp. MMS20-IR301 TaxID=2895946 RepID=UPI0028E2A37A|nr:helix-turn-helix domain-containing protein [Paenibacillus sp. MMS20-IR301]WNS46506.1 helix-turn-helix domain-containing protein [Paenibacillus sp. MMS20-IR301]
MSLTFISISCILVLAIVIFYWYRNIAIDNVNKANQNVLLNTETVFMNYKEIVQNYTMDFYANPNISTLMRSGDTGWSDQLYSALSQIRGALVVNQYLENAYIFGENEPVAIFENMPLNNEAKLELARRMRSSRIIESPFLWKTTQNNGAPVTLLTVFYNDRAFADSEYYGAVALTVNLAKLQNNLFTQQEGEATRYAVLDQNGGVLMHSALSGSTLHPEMLKQVAQSKADRGSFVYRGGGEAQLITYIHSAEDNLWFISETFYRDSIRELSGARNLMIALCLALILAASVSAYLISRRMYKPIGRLFGSIAHISGNEEALKTGSDFDTVNLELESIGIKLEQLKKESAGSALMRWLLSPRGSAADTGTPVMNLGAPDGAYCVCVIAVLEPGPVRDVPEAAEEAVLRIQAAFAGLAGVQSFRLHEESAVLILSELQSGSFGDYALFRSKWEEIAAQTPGSGGRCSFGVSGLASDLSLLKPKYNEAADCQQYIKFHGQQNIVFADDTIHLNSSSVPDSALAPLLQAVKQPELAGHIPQAVERLLEVARSYRAESATIAISRLAFELNRTAAGTGGSTRHSGFLDYYQQVWQLQSYDKLRDWIEQSCYAASSRIAGMGALQTRSLAAEAVTYIRENYSDPGLSLNALAEKLSVSPAYLSRLIAEEVNASFPDLINQLRLEQAELLLVTDLSLDIREIAGQVGYNSSTYFTTQFKKRYGVTPSKWRMNHILQQQE